MLWHAMINMHDHSFLGLVTTKIDTRSDAVDIVVGFGWILLNFVIRAKKRPIVVDLKKFYLVEYSLHITKMTLWWLIRNNYFFFICLLLFSVALLFFYEKICMQFNTKDKMIFWQVERVRIQVDHDQSFKCKKVQVGQSRLLTSWCYH